MKKILEIQGEDWTKGLSISPDLAYGGLFSSAENFDPFNCIGGFAPGYGSTEIGSGDTIPINLKYLCAYTDSTAPYLFGYGNRTSAGASFYRILLTDNTVTDYSSVMNTNVAPTTTTVAGGLTVFKQRIIYVQDDTIRSNSLTPTAPEDKQVLASGNINTTLGTAFCVGPDKNLYYLATTTGTIGRIITADGTTSNSSNVFALETGMIPRDLTHDGTYLVILADNNEARSIVGNGRCQVRFWDMVSGVTEKTWPIDDQYIIGGRYVNGMVQVIGSKGIWACDLGTTPKLVRPILDSTKLPTKPEQIKTNGNFLYWVLPTAGAKVYAYGNLIGKPILFSPFISSGSTDAGLSLALAGGKFYTSTDATKLYGQNTTRGNATLVTSTTQFSQPYTFRAAKITLKEKLSSGQAVAFSARTQNNATVVYNTETQSYSAANPKQTLIFNTPKGTIASFEDLALTLNPQAGATIDRVAIYADPLEDTQAIC